VLGVQDPACHSERSEESEPQLGQEIPREGTRRPRTHELHQPQRHADGDGQDCGDDLVTGERRGQRADGQEGRSGQAEPQVTGGRRSYLPTTNSQSRTGAVSTSSMVPERCSSASKRMVTTAA